MNSFVLAMGMAVLLTIVGTKFFIPVLRDRKIGQPIREEGNKEHYAKAGTPTMGGLVFTLVFVVLTIVFAGFKAKSLIVVFSCLGFALIGFIDDYEKVAKKQNLGLTEKQKLILQFAVALVVVLLAYIFTKEDYNSLYFPFFKNHLNISYLAIPVFLFIIVGTVNAVNLTDGLDGLVSSVSIPVFIGIFVISRDSNPELAKSALIFAGALLGFLVFNSNPASVFMGDTGSMAIGGAVAAMMLLLNRPIYLVFIGGVYMMEALSVIIQVVSYKTRNKKRVFLMSPIHHHFELKGNKETKIVAGFMVLSTLLTLFTIYII